MTALRATELGRVVGRYRGIIILYFGECCLWYLFRERELCGGEERKVWNPGGVVQKIGNNEDK